MAKEKQTEKKKSRWVFRIISRTAVILAIIGCTVSVVSIQSSIAEKKTELEQVQKQIDNLTADNEDLERILESGDIDGIWSAWHGKNTTTHIRMNSGFMTHPGTNQIIFGQQYAMGTERDKELYAGRDRKNL